MTKPQAPPQDPQEDQQENIDEYFYKMCLEGGLSHQKATRFVKDLNKIIRDSAEDMEEFLIQY